MSDLRARLASEWLKHQHTGAGYCRCKHKPEHGLTPLEAFATHFADVLRSLPGIAIVDRSDLDQLLAVAQMYVDAFREDELMSLTERMRLQMIEDILAAANAAEASMTRKGDESTTG